MNKLTIGMCTYDDFDGVFFTIQSLRMYHPNVFDIIVIDNNPGSAHGHETKTFVENWAGGKYIPFTDKQSSSCKNEVFKASQTKYTMCVDCHVLIEKNGIQNLLNHFEQYPETNNLIQGPLLMDDLVNYCTHFNSTWGSLMKGQWDTNKQLYEAGIPFEIPAMGMGLFACKTESWPGYNELFTGFGGEEWYIHDKFRKRGDRCICLPGLRWNHRFGRPGGAPYNNIIEERLWNYFIGAFEIYDSYNNILVDEIIENFKESLSIDIINQVYEAAKNAFSLPV